MIIDDGKGKGVSAGVNAENRLMTQTLTESQTTHHAHEGNVFSFPTGLIDYTTTASYNGLLYVKNTSPDKNFYVDTIRLTASVPCRFRVRKNPTLGTLITGGTLSEPVVSRFDSGNSFSGDFKYGADAQTVTDGTIFAEVYGAGALAEMHGILILTPNTTFSIEVQPSATAIVGCVMIGYQSEEEHHN
jgi:hypothetical protein